MPLGLRFSSFLVAVMLMLTGSAHGQSHPLDSVHVTGWVSAWADSSTTAPEVHFEWGAKSLQSGDSLEGWVSGRQRIHVWARGAMGQLQFTHVLLEWPDSMAFVLSSDTMGVRLVMGVDTMAAPWMNSEKGCFPTLPEWQLDRRLDRAMSEPFESSRFAFLKPWLENQCLTTGQIKRCASAFDDEERKLLLVQSTPCANPTGFADLQSIFSSQRYRAHFLEWAVNRP